MAGTVHNNTIIARNLRIARLATRKHDPYLKLSSVGRCLLRVFARTTMTQLKAFLCFHSLMVKRPLSASSQCVFFF